MAFTLVFGGEHYMIDILAGWVLAILAVELSDHFHDWRQPEGSAPPVGGGLGRGGSGARRGLTTHLHGEKWPTTMWNASSRRELRGSAG
jgi:hypothetical protein